MNTKLLMLLSAFMMGVLGVMLSFLPEEIASFLGFEPSAPIALILQILGAFYFAFAMLNWMAKANLIGGIYSRPVAVANTTHFLIGAITFIKFSLQQDLTYPWIAALLYTLFAAAFTYILYTHPVKKED